MLMRRARGRRCSGWSLAISYRGSLFLKFLTQTICHAPLINRLAALTPFLLTTITQRQGKTIMTAANEPFPQVNATASLLLSHRPVGRRVVIIGSGRLAASRAFASLEAGAAPVVVALPSHSNNEEPETCCEELEWRIERGEVQLVTAPRSDSEVEWTQLLEQLDAHGEAGNAIFAVCITDTLHLGDEVTAPAATSSSAAAPALTPAQRSMSRARLVQRICRQRRIPINVADQPSLCDFSFPATHRFPSADGTSALQVAVTTNGRGCRLAGRIRREIVAALPRSVGDAVERVGDMRELARAGDRKRRGSVVVPPAAVGKKKQARVGAAPHPDRDEEDSALDSTPLNSPVPQLKSNGSYFGKEAAAALEEQLEETAEEQAERTKRRMRWVAQISEYWPIEYLGSLKEEQMAEILDTYAGDAKPAKAALSGVPADGAETPRGRPSSRRNSIPSATNEVTPPPGARRDSSQHSLALVPPPPILPSKGHIYLLGSGPGHPGLLTTMAHALLTSPTTHLVLSDKLVPAAILRLVPSTTPLVIARKFPGNAEGAQSELIALALRAALEEGKTVVRLKQGDPFVYGRGGEEVLAFRKAGIECSVVPGISSSMAAPLMLGVPVTQRGAADSMVLCTGVGRGGKLVKLPGYERARSTVILMGVARLKDVVATLTEGWSSEAASSSTLACGSATSGRNGAAYPPHTPIAIIERASSADQRLVASTLGGIVESLERTGEQRPPGMMLIGWAVLSLDGEGDVSVLDDETTCLEECAAVLEQGAEKQEAYNSARATLDALDRKRVDRWLGQRGYVVREGLSEAYTQAMARFSPASPSDSAAPQEATTPPLASAAQQQQAPDLSLAARDATGWAPARYAADKGLPSGGWASNEVAPYVPAADRAAWQRDEEYARASARRVG